MFYLPLPNFWLVFFVRKESHREALFPQAMESLAFSVIIFVVLITIFFIVGLVFFPLVSTAHFYYIFTKLSQ